MHVTGYVCYDVLWQPTQVTFLCILLLPVATMMSPASHNRTSIRLLSEVL